MGSFSSDGEHCVVGETWAGALVLFRLTGLLEVQGLMSGRQLDIQAWTPDGILARDKDVGS